MSDASIIDNTESMYNTLYQCRISNIILNSNFQLNEMINPTNQETVHLYYRYADSTHIIKCKVC